MMRSSNPVLNDKAFENEHALLGVERMTINGAVNKTTMLLGLVVVPAVYTWTLFFTNPENPAVVIPWALGGMLVGFVLALVTVFKHTWSPVTAPLYAVAEGLFLGALSAIFEARYPGIVVQAVMLTFGTLFALLLVYRSGLIKVTENFRLGVFAATGGIMLIYVAGFVLSFFSIRIPYIHESGLIGIGFSLFVVVIASLNLVLDFDFIEKASEQGAPKYMEWYAGFGLMVTLIWLYIEFLRLLSKLRDR